MRKRIAIITNSLSLGGAERVSVLLGEWLNSQGNDVAIVTLNKDREDGYRTSSEITRIAINPNSTSSNMEIVFKLRTSIKNFNPSIVLIMGVPLCVRVIPALFGLKTSIIVSERNDPARFSGKQVTKIFSRMLMKYANGYVFQTKDAMEYYSTSIQKKSTIIPNPLTVENMPKPYQGERQKKIVTAGRLVSQKNHALLIKAFSKVVSVHTEHKLVIYGNGSDRNKLESLIKELNLVGKVFLPGASNEIFNEINDAEMFVLSSNYEGLPNALIEAMALGLPVISTDCPCGGPRSLIEHEVNGILVPVGNEEEMVNALNKLINNKFLAESIGVNAREIKGTLNSDKVCKMWHNFFETILDKKFS